MGIYFGTDGIRGKAYEFLSFDLAFKVGKALVILGNDTLVIARDTRESGPMLVDAIKNGAKSSGIDVMDLGVLPTPALAYICQKLDSIGVMVTASHNPYHDNGIKVFHRGNKLSLADEEEIELMIDEKAKPVVPQQVGSDLDPIDAFAYYHELFSSFGNKTSLRIGLDLANGATNATAKPIFSAISDHIFTIGDNPDGRNINSLVGSTSPLAIVNLVRKEGLDLGFAIDGDGDRVIMADGEGRIYDGDFMIYIIACYLKQNGLLKHDAIVLTKMSNLGIIKALNDMSIQVLQADIGDKYVFEEMDANDLVLGGENSGHIINRLLLDTGDGVLNAAMITMVISASGKAPSELVSNIQLFPDKLHNLRNYDKALVNHPEVVAKVRELRDQLGPQGKILVRASGTEPLIRISVSAPDMETVDDCIRQVAEVIDRASKQE